MPQAPEAIIDPVGTIMNLVTSVDPAADRETLRRIIEHVGGGRAKRRRLATELATDPSVLSTRHSPGSNAAGDLLLRLRAAGTAGISPPKCADCEREITSMQRRGEHWYCSPCFVRPEVCAGCGNARKATFRDRHGQPRCSRCPDHDPRDPRELLATLITSADPSLTADTVNVVLRQVVTKAAHLQKLAWALEEAPELLTGERAQAPFPMVLRFIDALCEAGATQIRRPACPHCGRVVTLSKQRNGLRICRTCFAHARAVPCNQCGRVREPASRDTQGQPLCPYCLISDPINLEDCVRCGRRQRVATRTPDGPICGRCNTRPILTCTVCGRTAPCMISKVTGEPRCAACVRSWAYCSRCGTLAQTRAGTRDAPLCATCAVPDAEFWTTCLGCGTTGRLLAGACRRCHLHDRLDQLLAHPGTGHARADLLPLRQALADVDRPEVALGWIRRDRVRALLTELVIGHRPLTHAALDELPDSKTLQHLRSVLVTAGTLPIRDEHLAQLEHWTNHVVADRPDAYQKQLLHSYAVWHVLRLRHRTRTTPATHNQAYVVRHHITAATAFLDWLTEHRHNLATCTQANLDTWTASASIAQRGATGDFLRWARHHKHTRLDFPATRWNGPTRAIDTEARWEQARRLLHDDTLKPGDRLAGLLILLYAQQPAAISRLTFDHVHTDGNQVRLRLGQDPVILPEPLATLMLQMVNNRRGHATIGDREPHPGYYPVDDPASQSAPIASPNASTRSASNPDHPAPPHSANSPLNSPPPSSPACWASISASPSPGNTHRPWTGWVTPPTSASAREGQRRD